MERIPVTGVDIDGEDDIADDDVYPPHNAFRDGQVHVMGQMCGTCIFRPDNRMHLAPGRVDEMVQNATTVGSAIVCHSTLMTDPQTNAVCRGFYDRHRTQPLQIAQRLGMINWQDRTP